MLFDTHAHMDDHAFDEDRQQLLMDLPNRQIGLLMNPGCSRESSYNAVKLANEFDYIYAAVGSHPDAADEVNETVLEEYRTLCKLNNKVKAIGEIGLSGEVRSITHLEQRLSEVHRLGFTKCIVPAHRVGEVRDFPGLTLIPVENIRQALRIFGNN